MMTDLKSRYRRPAGEIAWQKQLRDQYLHEGTPPGVDLAVKRARVVKVSRRMAESIIFRYEWLGTMSSTSLHYGVMFGHFCGGVCCVAVNGSGTAGPTVSDKFGLFRRDIATLARGACVHWAPAGANSKLVSWTSRLVSLEKKAKLLLAYSDSDAGEIGTIYQACGWAYVGRTKRPKDAEYISPLGRIVNSQTIGAWARKNRVRYRDYSRELVKRGWELKQSNPKLIYVKQLCDDRTLAKRIESMSQPYPKRARSIDGDAPANHAGESGSIPTRALQPNGES